jgi:hypothetical protein
MSFGIRHVWSNPGLCAAVPECAGISARRSEPFAPGAGLRARQKAAVAGSGASTAADADSRKADPGYGNGASRNHAGGRRAAQRLGAGRLARRRRCGGVRDAQPVERAGLGSESGRLVRALECFACLRGVGGRAAAVARNGGARRPGARLRRSGQI